MAKTSIPATKKAASAKSAQRTRLNTSTKKVTPPPPARVAGICEIDSSLPTGATGCTWIITRGNGNAQKYLASDDLTGANLAKTLRKAHEFPTQAAAEKVAKSLNTAHYPKSWSDPFTVSKFVHFPPEPAVIPGAMILRNGEPFRLEHDEWAPHNRPCVLEGRGRWLAAANHSSLTADLGKASTFDDVNDAERVLDVWNKSHNQREQLTLRVLDCTSGGLVIGTMDFVEVPPITWSTSARFTTALAQSAAFETSSIAANDAFYEDVFQLKDSPMGALMLQEYEAQRRDEEREPADWLKGNALNKLMARLLYTGRMLERSGIAPGYVKSDSTAENGGAK